MSSTLQLNDRLQQRAKYRTTLTKSFFSDFLAAAYYLSQKIRSRFPRKSSKYILRSKYAQYPLICRSNSSDSAVFFQIFLENEYSCLRDISDVNWVIDCGANVGYSSVYFLNCFPNCKVIAIEPDEENFRVLKENLEPYKDRAKAIKSAIWSDKVGLKISEICDGDGREWSRQVRACQPEESPEIEAIDLNTLIEEEQIDRVSILKMDIEGAEAVVFAENYESWLKNVENIAIELHDGTQFGSGSAAFFQAISDRNFNISKSGELTVCKQ